MWLKQTCPFCGRRLWTDEREMGRTASCAPCRRIFQTPLEPDPSAAPQRQSGVLWLVLGVASFVVLLGVLAVGFYVHGRTAHAAEDAKEDLARAQIRGKLVPAVKTYQQDLKYNPTGEPPRSLTALLDDPDVGLTLQQVIDPWGKPFRYAARTVHGSPDGFDVWTVTPDGREIGNWGL